MTQTLKRRVKMNEFSTTFRRVTGGFAQKSPKKRLSTNENGVFFGAFE